MRVLHIVAGLMPGGGVAEAVPRLCGALSLLGHKVVLATLNGPSSDATALAETQGVRIERFKPSFPHFLCFSWNMLFKLNELAITADVVHVHGAWQFPVWLGCYLALKNNKPLIRTPHGSFVRRALQKSSWKKYIASTLFENKYLARANMLHATAEGEARDLLLFNRKIKEIVIIPHGVDCKSVKKNTRTACTRTRKVLFLSRLDPIKGIECLIAAWKKVDRMIKKKQFYSATNWKLEIVGPGDKSYTKYLKNDCRQAKCSESIFFKSPVYGESKWNLFQEADVLVLPSRSENFGLVVAEALACGVPVITTHGTPWQGLEIHRCGWWVDLGVEPLATALAKAMALSDDERREMGARGRRWMETEFRWESVAARMEEVYQRLLRGPIVES